jgi:hypothetical protein
MSWEKWVLVVFYLWAALVAVWTHDNPPKPPKGGQSRMFLIITLILTAGLIELVMHA